MSTQKYFDYHFLELQDHDNFFVNKSNKNAFNAINSSNLNQFIYLHGPKKSGKSHLLNIWKQNNDAINFKNNISQILKLKQNVCIDNFDNNFSEEEIFHIINHCNSYNLKILITSLFGLSNLNIYLHDLSSRLKAFYYVNIDYPDEEMCKILLTKLFYEKQIIIKNKEIFDYIFNRINRTYNDIFLIVKKLDKLSLQKKRQLTIPLIKEIL